MTTVAALAAALALAAPTMPSHGQPSLPPPGLVDGPTAQKLVSAGAAILDVRTPPEYQAGHIPGARLIPFDQLAVRAAELPPKGQPVLLYCRTGRRTAMAAATLQQLGYTAIYDLQGLSNWTGPVEAGAAR